MTRTVVVWGASSGAGKSLVATALCRWARRQGIDVAPFKAQNMSNHARVVRLDGAGADDAGEIGAAQFFQALAAGVAPHVDLNPVLLKPERDDASQVVVHGRVDPALRDRPWRARSAVLAEAAHASFERLAARHALIVVEGAGSPAEINLAAEDYVNLGTARWARAAGSLAAWIVVDIDRGGAFAHLHGTWSLLPDDLRPHVSGFLLNRFRGDAALLAPGPERLEAMTGVPVVGVLPMWREHGLPDEDAVPAPRTPGPAGRTRVAVVAGPHASNLDEFQPLAEAAALRWVRDPQALADADWIVLPGSKQTSGDLAWLRTSGMADAIARAVAAGTPVLGICGGMQALGRLLADPAGIDGEAFGACAGLGHLPLATRFAAPKRVRRTCARFTGATGPWRALAGLAFAGYEIRAGRTDAVDGRAAAVALVAADGEPIGWQAGSVLGVAAHGLFEDPAVLRAVTGRDGRPLDARLDGLADFLEAHVGSATLGALCGIGPATAPA